MRIKGFAFKRFPRPRRPSKAKAALYIAGSLLALCALALGLVWGASADTLQSQLAAERYRGENEQRYAQASAFFPETAQPGLAEIRSFRGSMEQKLLDVSLESKEGAPALWFDA